MSGKRKKRNKKEKEKDVTLYLRGVEDKSVFEAELRSRINAVAALLRYTRRKKKK